MYILFKKNNNKKDAIREELPFFTKDVFKKTKYTIGDYTYGKPDVLDWNEGAILKMGKFCSIAEDVKIFLGGNHRTDWVTTYPFNMLTDHFPSGVRIYGHPVTKGDVEIGNDVWVGRGVTIMSGVKIGDGAVLGANSVIAKNINPYEIVIGNPGRVIRKRFDESTIEKLLSISWWNWPIEKINKEIEFLCDENINCFIERNIVYQ